MAVQMVIMVIGAFVWAYVISSGCGIIATLNPHRVHYRNVMDELNYFAKDKKLPRLVTVKLREFLSQTAHVHRQSKYNTLLDNMSARLKADAALVWAKATLLKVPYFNSGPIEDEFLASCALSLKSKVFCRTEFVPLEHLVVVERGIAAKEGRISTKGSCLGVDMILNSNTFRNLAPAIALTFVVQVASLEKKSLETLILDYPLARREVRKGSFRIAFTRAVVQVAKVIVQSREMGMRISIPEAFVGIRKAKQQMQLNEMQFKEPTRKLLANNIHDLADRTESIAKENGLAREALARQVKTLHVRMDSAVGQINAKLDGLVESLAPLLGSRAPAATPQIPPANGSAEGGDGASLQSGGVALHGGGAPLNGVCTPLNGGSVTFALGAHMEASGKGQPLCGEERRELHQEGRAELGGSALPLKGKAPSTRRKKSRSRGSSPGKSCGGAGGRGADGGAGGAGGAAADGACGEPRDGLSC